MAGWGTDTPWRQGHILTLETAIHLGLSKEDENPESVVLVISHDCDLAQVDLVAEPNCEVIVGTIITKTEGGCTHAKNPRRLHLTFSGGTTVIAGDFLASKKQYIRKSDLPEQHGPATHVRLTNDERSVLQRWLALRYRRSTFPTEFDRRLSGIKDKIWKAVEQTEGHITAAFFSVDKNTDVERAGEDDLYELKIILLGNSESIGADVHRVFANARSRIHALFKAEFRTGAAWKNIELDDVFLISDQTMTVRDSWQLREWHG